MSDRIDDAVLADDAPDHAAVEPGVLYIVPTPIGNLGDITHRAVQVLDAVDVVAAEDTRHSQRLFQHIGLQVNMLSLHNHNEEKRTKLLISKLQGGASVALISDAGTPLISDPGYVLVSECRKQSIRIVALPGACAAITALSASGLPTDRFIFVGFLPVKQVALTQALERLQQSPYTSVCYEAPRRIEQTLQAMVHILPEDQTVVLAKELTKTFETYVTGSAQDVLNWLHSDVNHQRGEFVLMVGPNPQRNESIPAEALKLHAALVPLLPPKQAAAIVAEHYGLKKNALYQATLHKNTV
ncbi:16S rRNA (cytidine(1402)-2'-O)-methyltransferase [Alteromonas oceanisediminis]|uniref:16S rRNA (cytidine(1402)-2'-O)-methyltransferase n=1 Tax=Alteromonas oceanisediminis TaxID=2836180 RepID=UPI001BDB26F2|nr:16S rRNA (cytidine(1402)-2'-O)-methyltransferase [Alteromonas oceanisediminis]MBT0585463.1 16S rRNA (cytidine(1402)-2'-O)-methyltransferase [Alteromonas oceanisediminis]